MAKREPKPYSEAWVRKYPRKAAKHIRDQAQALKLYMDHDLRLVGCIIKPKSVMSLDARGLIVQNLSDENTYVGMMLNVPVFQMESE